MKRHQPIRTFVSHFEDPYATAFDYHHGEPQPYAAYAVERQRSSGVFTALESAFFAAGDELSELHASEAATESMTPATPRLGGRASRGRVAVA